MRGDFEGAVQGYKEVLAIRPDYAPSLLLLAQVHLHLGRTNEARETYERLLRVDPSYRGRDPELDVLVQ
jgi:tetratricopeptide (TPR) repeat protein